MGASQTKREHLKKLLLSLTMIGFEFVQDMRRDRWWFKVPEHVKDAHGGKGFVAGYFKWRWEAVESAARQFDVGLGAAEVKAPASPPDAATASKFSASVVELVDTSVSKTDR